MNRSQKFAHLLDLDESGEENIDVLSGNHDSTFTHISFDSEKEWVSPS